MADDINEKIDKLAKDIKKLSKAPAKVRDPIKDMKDAGFGAFTSEGMKILDTINTRYTGDFLTFFIELEKKYIGYTRKTAEVAKIKNTRQKIGDLSVFIDQLRDGIISPDPAKDIQKLRQSIDELDSDFQFFVNSDQVSNVLSENMASVASSTGITLEDLKFAQGNITRKAKEITKPASRIPPELKDFGKDLLKGVAVSALAPFAPFIPTASKLFQGSRRRAETVENFALDRKSVV